jgi:hypothetical protein
MCRQSSPAAHRKAGPTFRADSLYVRLPGLEPDGLAAKAESHIGHTLPIIISLAEPAQKSTTLRQVVSRRGLYSDGIFIVPA